jgi:hypothetical protein
MSGTFSSLKKLLQHAHYQNVGVPAADVIVVFSVSVVIMGGLLFARLGPGHTAARPPGDGRATAHTLRHDPEH